MKSHSAGESFVRWMKKRAYKPEREKAYEHRGTINTNQASEGARLEHYLRQWST